MLQAREDLIEAIQAFLNKYNQIPPKEKKEHAAKVSSQYWKPAILYDDYDYEKSTIPLNEIDSRIPPSNAIIPDEFIKSSVEDLVPIPSESEDTSGSDSECILPSYDDFSPINVYEEKFVTFSNPLFNSNDDFTSSDDESLSNEDDIECKVSYDSNLDESTFLVTPLSDSNEDECFTPSNDVELLLYRDPSTPMISVVSILEGFTDEPPLEENDDLFELESKKNDWKKILYDDPIDDLIFDPGGEVDEIDAFLDIDIPMNIKDDFYDSKGDVLYPESLLSDDTTPSPPPKVFLDCGPRSLRDINDLMIMVKVFDPDVSAYSFYSLEPVAYKCPMEVYSSTCFFPNITMI
ncbi:hypothetical protein Tco_0236107 [Tanacetum coccineum]